MPARSASAPAAGQEGHDAYRQIRHFGSLDGLRCLCILMVLWHHAPVWEATEEGARILSRGFTGVAFFFVLSGYLITTLLLREAQANGGRFSLRGFYWRRVLRIVPVYFLVVTVVSVYYIFVKNETQYIDLVPFYYLFLSNFLTGDIPLLAPTWSLSVEEQYYLVWPLLLLVLPRRWVLPVLGGLVALNLAAVTGALRPLGIVPFQWGVLTMEMFSATYAPILLGSALAVVLHDRAGFARVAGLVGHRMAAPFCFAALFVLLQLLPSDLEGWPNLVLHVVMTACLASIVVREDNGLARLFAFRPFVRIGETSYGIYLYHLLALHVANVGLARLGVENTWAVLVLYSLLSILIAEVSFRTFEAFFLNLRHKGLGRVRASV